MGYQELAAWQHAVDLCDDVYDLTDSFPKHELFALTGQLRRAAVRVPSCIAEGEGRNTNGERLQLLGYARGSIYEIETQLILAVRRRYVKAIPETLERAKKTLDGYIAYVTKKRGK